MREIQRMAVWAALGAGFSTLALARHSLAEVAVIRVLPNGRGLDTSFNGTGEGTYDSSHGWNNAVGSISIGPNGKLVISATADCCGKALAGRINANGGLDTSFAGGDVIDNFAEDTATGTSAIVDGSNRVLLAGFSDDSSSKFTLNRYATTNGSLDTTFGTGGRVATSVLTNDGQVMAMTFDSTGRIVVVGNSCEGPNCGTTIARYLPTGALDTTFGSGGVNQPTVAQLLQQGSDTVFTTAVAIGPNQKIVVAGIILTTVGDAPVEPIVGRFNANGSVDTTFGFGGVAVPFTFEQASTNMTVKVDSSNRVLLGAIGPHGGMAIARFTTSGALDSSFGTGGVVEVGSNVASQCCGIALLSTGSVLAGAVLTSGSSMEFGLIRVTSAGVLDQNFGLGGLTTTSFDDAGAQAIAVDVSGNIVMAGVHQDGT